MGRAIAAVLSRDIVKDRVICNLIGVVSFVVLTAMGAYIRIPIPFTPVHITLQTFFVILAGAILGSRLGSLSQAAYIGLGASGLAVFQGYSGGMAHIMGPTCGYLAGFILAPIVVAKMVSLRKDPTFGWVAFSMAAGSFVILTLGAAYLAYFLKLGPRSAFMLGIFYFLPGDFLKVASAAFIYFAFGKRISGAFKVNK